MEPRQYSIEIYGPLPQGGRLDVIPIDPDVVSCQIAETMPGGFGGMIIGIHRQTRDGRIFGGWGRPSEVREWSHVVVKAHGKVIGEGQADIAELDGDGMATGITTTPYYAAATHDRWYQSQDQRWLAAGNVVADVVRTTCPLITPATGPEWVDSGVQYQPKAWNGRYLDALLSEVMKAGGRDGYPHDFFMGENRILHWKPRKPPATAKYVVPLEPGKATVQRQSSQMIGSAAVQYTPFGGTQQILNQQEVPGFRQLHGGRMRAELVQNAVMGQPAALNLQSTLKRTRGVSQWAGKISYTGFRGLLMAGGLEQPPEVVHCGEWVQMGALPTLLMITTKRYDANIGNLELQLSNV